jgi:TRAP-type C4-dicarboxylate transport system permease large subunit
VLALLILLLVTVGMFLDGVSIFLIFVPLLCPSCSSTNGTRCGSA